MNRIWVNLNPIIDALKSESVDLDDELARVLGLRSEVVLVRWTI